MISFFTGLMKISRKYAKEYGKPDVIMGSSAHPLTSIAGILIARRFHVSPAQILTANGLEAGTQVLPQAMHFLVPGA